MGLEGLGKLEKKSNDHIRTRTCAHPAFSIAPQPSMLTRAPKSQRIPSQVHMYITNPYIQVNMVKENVPEVKNVIP
jgi:hypothetical protein